MASNESLEKLEEKAKPEDGSEKKSLSNTMPMANSKEKKDTTELDEKRPLSPAGTAGMSIEQSQNQESKNASSEVKDAEKNDGELFEIFNETECMKFAEKLYKIVEELRMDRVSERENELRIQKLMSEKGDLERLKDDEIMNKNDLIQHHNHKQEEVKKQCKEKLHSFQEDKTKHMLEKQSAEKETKALKDEIRALHITKYTMEKLVKDQERQIQSHGTTTTNYLTQLAKLEKQCKDVFMQSSQIITAIDKVEANVNTSSKLHKKLTYINGHQHCILKSYKRQLDQTKQDLITVEARQASLTTAENNTRVSPSFVHLEDELRMQKQLCQQVQVQLNDTRQENQELLKSLNSAHELLGRHIETNNKFVETEAVLQVEMDELGTKCEQLRDELNTQTSSVRDKDAKLNETTMAHDKKEKEFCEKLEKLANENSLLSKEKEELNSTWFQKNVEQTEEKDKMKGKMSELEVLLEATKQEMAKQTDEITRLEDHLKNQVTRNEDLLQKSQQDISEKANDIIKWRKRTEELLENEEKIKIEIDELKIRKEQIHQNTQTEKMETQERETNTNVNDEQIGTIISSTDHGTQTGDTQPSVTSETLPGECIPKSSDLESNTAEQKIAKHDKPGQPVVDDGKKPDRGITHLENCTDRQSDPIVKNSRVTNDHRDIQTDKEIIRLKDKQQSPDKEMSCRKTKGTPPPVQEASSAKKACLQKTKEYEITPEQNTTSKNNISSESKESLVHSEGVEREPITLANFTRERAALLAVVKPAISSRGLGKENISSSCSYDGLLGSNSITNPASTEKTSTDNPIRRVVQTSSIEPQVTHKPFSANGGDEENFIAHPTSTNTSSQLSRGVVQPQPIQPHVPNNQLSGNKESHDGNPITHPISHAQQVPSNPPSGGNNAFHGGKPIANPTSTTNTSSYQYRAVIPPQPIQPQGPNNAHSDKNMSRERISVAHSTSTTSTSSQLSRTIPRPPSTQSELKNNPLREQHISPKKQRVEITGQPPLESVKLGDQSTSTKLIQNTHDARSGQLTTSGQPQKNDSCQKDKGNKNEGKADHTAGGMEDFCFSDEEDESIPRAIGTQIDRIEAFLKNDRLRLNKKRKTPDE